MSYSLSSFGADPTPALLPEAPVEPVVRPIPLGWWLVGGAVALYLLWPKAPRARYTSNKRRRYRSNVKYDTSKVEVLGRYKKPSKEERELAKLEKELERETAKAVHPTTNVEIEAAFDALFEQLPRGKFKVMGLPGDFRVSRSRTAVEGNRVAVGIDRLSPKGGWVSAGKLWADELVGIIVPSRQPHVRDDLREQIFTFTEKPGALMVREAVELPVSAHTRGRVKSSDFAIEAFPEGEIRWREMTPEERKRERERQLKVIAWHEAHEGLPTAFGGKGKGVTWREIAQASRTRGKPEWWARYDALLRGQAFSKPKKKTKKS